MNDSYKALCQDGNHYNASINRSINNMLPSNVLNALYYMSDYLPITMKLIVGGGVDLDESGIQDTWFQVFSESNERKDFVIGISSNTL